MFGSLLGSVVGGIASASAARKADKLAQQTLQYQQEQQGKVWDAAAPYMEAGNKAVADLNDPNAFTTSPGYDFRLNTGLEAVAGNQAVNGLLRSGGAMKALSDYGQNTASDEYNRWFAQRSNVAGMGLQGAGIGAGVATQNSANASAASDTRSNAALSQANAWSGIAGSLGATADRYADPAAKFVTNRISKYG